MLSISCVRSVFFLFYYCVPVVFPFLHSRGYLSIHFLFSIFPSLPYCNAPSLSRFITQNFILYSTGFSDDAKFVEHSNLSDVHLRVLFSQGFRGKCEPVVKIPDIGRQTVRCRDVIEIGMVKFLSQSQENR